jgi:uncharacterized phage protein gp47/JayE
MASLYSSKEEITRQIEIDIKSSGIFKKHNFRNPLSKIGTIVRALGNSIFLFIDTKILKLSKNIHPHSSDEDGLQEWLKRYGLEWKEAVSAKHRIRIGSSSSPSSLVNIPVGQIVSTLGDSPIQYQTLFSVSIDSSTPIDTRGFYTVEVDVQCLEFGELGNVTSDSIVNIESPPDGIDVCYNPDNTPLLAGSERESITDVRSRIFNFENAENSMFTKNWYISEAEKYVFVKRAIFISAKTLNRPGTAKLLLIGSGYTPISNSNLELIQDDFNGEEKNPGGSAFVICENAQIQEVNKDVIVYFADSDSILPLAQLNEVVESYFRTLNTGDDFKESDLRYLFYNLPKVFKVTILPIGDVTIPDSVIAVPGVFNLSGQVYIP